MCSRKLAGLRVMQLNGWCMTGRLRASMCAQQDVESTELHAQRNKKTGYTCRIDQKAHKREEVLNISNHNRQESHEEIALVALLKACAKKKDLYKGSSIHADILKKGLLQKNLFLGSAVINMYAKCGALARGQEVFNELPIRNVVSWNALIAGYAQHGHGKEALNCFARMAQEGLSPNAVTFLSVIKACGGLRAVRMGSDIHAEIIRQGLLGKENLLGNALVDMYAKCGALAKAQEVFNELPFRNVVSWNALIGGYAEHGLGEEALDSFEQMQDKGLSPNGVTFLGVLKACGRIGATEKGIEIHAEIVRQEMSMKNSVLGNALVDMYAKCGALMKAQEVFDKLLARDIVSWNALLAGYCQHGHGEEVLICFEHMQREGLSPNATTLACALQACGSIGEAVKGKEIHDEIARKGLLGEDCVLGTALVDMYAKCGELVKAQQVFDELLVKDIISWTALIAGYCQHGHGEEALNCFEQMKRRGLCPDGATFPCILKACSSIVAVEKGEEVHAEIITEGLCGKVSELASAWSALVDMYVKCGALSKAQEVFDKLPFRDVVSWTALMAGYAQAGKHMIAFDLFNKMIGEDIKPNLVTFIVLLNACSYLGLVKEGESYFASMHASYGIIPTLEHHTCMVDLFGRAGHFDKAMEVIKKMPSSDYLRVWFALLSACRKWGNVKLARLAFEHAVRLDEKSGEAYICMRSIYAAAGMREEADKIEFMRLRNEAWTKPGGCWWTGATVNIPSFCV